MSLPERSERPSSLAQTPPVAPPDSLSTVDESRSPVHDRPPAPETLLAQRYELLGEIAHGGMGVVMRCRDHHLNRDLAIKLLHESVRDRADVVRRFLEEAEITGQLQHPGIVPIHERGILPDGRPFFAMKLVEGRTLADLLKERPDPSHERQRFLNMFLQVCQAVAYAHSKGVIHRDLKPANVMVGAFGEVQVMDWGLAKVLGGPQGASSNSLVAREDGATQVGAVMGTFAYMPPEQARGEVERVDRRSDVFGLGAILCVVLTGQPPYRGNREEVLAQAQRGNLGLAFERLEKSGADGELVAIVKACLQSRREDRPADAAAVAESVASYLASVEQRLRQAEVERAAAQARAVEERKRRRLTVGLALAVLAVVVLGGTVGWWWENEAMVQRQEVESGLARAAELRGESRWKEARVALAQAQVRLGESGPGDLRQRLQRASAALDLVDRLDAIRMKTITHNRAESHFAAADGEYAKAFQESGIATVGEDPAAAATRVRDSAIAGQLLATLDIWASVTVDPERRGWIFALARKVDPHEGRDRLRDPEAWKDLAVLRQRAKEAKAADLAPALAVAVGGKLEGADGAGVQLLLEVQRQHPNDFWLALELGQSLILTGKPAEAPGFARVALALRPDSPVAWNNVGYALSEKGQLEEAIAHWRKAIALDSAFALAHTNLGFGLEKKGRWDEAIEEYRTAIALDPKLALAHNNLGFALARKGELEEAIALYRKAIVLEPNHILANTNLVLALESLGLTLSRKGRLDEATKAYREAIALKPGLPRPRALLAEARLLQGRFPEALDATREALALVPVTDPLRTAITQQLQLCEQLLALEKKLPDLLAGAVRPANLTEQVLLADLCRLKRLHAAATRFYGEIIDANPGLARNVSNGLRANAARSAALAGCGAGADAAQLDEKERLRLRSLALAWLRTDLALWENQARNTDVRARQAVEAQLKLWQEEADLAVVRNRDALARLPEAERDDWRKFWDDVASVREKAMEKK